MGLWGRGMRMAASAPDNGPTDGALARCICKALKSGQSVRATRVALVPRRARGLSHSAANAKHSLKASGISGAGRWPGCCRSAWPKEMTSYANRGSAAVRSKIRRFESFCEPVIKPGGVSRGLVGASRSRPCKPGRARRTAIAPPRQARLLPAHGRSEDPRATAALTSVLGSSRQYARSNFVPFIRAPVSAHIRKGE